MLNKSTGILGIVTIVSLAAKDYSDRFVWPRLLIEAVRVMPISLEMSFSTSYCYCEG